VALAAWATFATVGAAALLPSPASAATISGAITSVSTTAGKVGQWSDVQFTGGWAVPDGSRPGDTFTLQLPSQLAWLGSDTFNLTDSAGNVVATAKVDADGSVVFTLTDYVGTHQSDVRGQFTFNTQYTATESAAGPQTLTFDVGGQTIKVPITLSGPPAPCTSGCNDTTPLIYTSPFKWMWWTDHTDSKTKSQLGANVGSAQHNDVTVSDTPNAGLALDCSTVAYHVGLTMDHSGKITDPQDVTYVPTIACSSSSLTVHWSDLPADENVQVYVVSDVTDSSQLKFTNSGSVVINGTSSPVAASLHSESASGNGAGTAVRPAVSIAKYDTVDGSINGLQPTTPGKQLEVNTPTAITLTITNTGSEPLSNVKVTDATSAGPQLTGLSCDFAALGGPSTGTSWNGPFAVGASFDCTGTIPAMAHGTQETDTATVDAQGQYDSTAVTSTSTWNGHTTAAPGTAGPSASPTASATTTSASSGIDAVSTTAPVAAPTAVGAGYAGSIDHGQLPLEALGAALLASAGAGGLLARRRARQH
jgi:hypothetical protein